jgi:hypothetical protein
MSATTVRVKEAVPELEDQNNAEYETLVNRVKDVERQYKLGEVDEKEIATDGSGGIRWKFAETLDELETLIVHKYQERFLREQSSWYYKFIAIQGEAKEYFDTATPSYRLDMYLLAQKLFRELPEQVALDDGVERIVLKNKIRVIVGGLEYLYSIGDFATAIMYAQGLYDFVVGSGLATSEKPANGTLAVIYNFLGRALRQRGIDDDYQQAIDYFYKCSESYFEMARRRQGNQDADADVIYARTRAMVSLAFGAGFLFYNAQSDLVRAKALIAQARLAFLRENADICCELHSSYLELLYASILRAEAGELAITKTSGIDNFAEERAAAEDKLNCALKILDECGQTLASKPKYFVHTLYQKALVCLYLGPEHYDKALECVNELLSRAQDNARWLANGLILKSHVARRLGHFDSALGDALRAYNLAGNHLPVRIEALLARGQAQVERRQFNAARYDFEKALELNNSANLKLTAVTHLLLVDLAIKEQKPGQAYERFAKIGELMPSIRHGFILNKFRELAATLDELQTDFIIPGSSKELDYKKLDSELQCWLLKKALREDRNLTRAAQRLNVTKKTIYLWLAKYNVKI